MFAAELTSVVNINYNCRTLMIISKSLLDKLRSWKSPVSCNSMCKIFRLSTVHTKLKREWSAKALKSVLQIVRIGIPLQPAPQNQFLTDKEDWGPFNQIKFD